MKKYMEPTNALDGIELLELLKKIWSKNKIIKISLIVSAILAIIIIVFTPKQYKTEISLLSESNSSGSASGLLRQMGGLSGANLGGVLGLDFNGGTGSEVLIPDLYPEIVKSTTFLLEILNEKITEPKTGNEISVSHYLNYYTKPSLWGVAAYVLKKLKPNKEEDLIVKEIEGQPLKLNRNQTDLLITLSEIIEVKIIKSGGSLTGGESKIITVGVEIQDPYLSAVLAQRVVTNLKQYIINYNTGKAKKDLEFIEARYKEAQDRFYKAQKNLADYDDSYKNVILSSVNSKRQHLETENSLAATLYNNLAQKLEQSKILIQDRTPVYTVIEPAKVPLRKSKPKSSLILISMLFMGGFVGLTIILAKEIIK